mgnify:CR=1 FL=1
MGGKKKSGRKKHSLEKLLLASKVIILVTVIIQLITAVVDLIDKLTG